MALAGITLGFASGSTVSAQEIQTATAPVAAPSSPAGAASAKGMSYRRFSGAYEIKTRDGSPSDVAALARAEDASQTQKMPQTGAKLAADMKRASDVATALGLRSARLSDGSWVGSPTLTAGGTPIFTKSFNKVSAILIKTNQVWPASAGGTVGTGLTGAGRTVLMWDGGLDGVPLQSHPEFQSGGSSRIFLGGGSDPETHATAVAGTLAAAGLVTFDTPNSEARGMAFETNVLAAPEAQASSQLSLQTLEELKDRRVSNHSYGFDHGWTYLIVNTPNGDEIYLFWEGDIGISQTESQFFGLYTDAARFIDQQACLKPYFQTVWAAGNQRLQGPDSLPVLLFQGYSGVFYATFRNGAIGFTNAGTTNQGSIVFIPLLAANTYGNPVPVGNVLPALDGGATGFDTLSGQGVSKNALTVGSVDGSRTLADVFAATAHGPTDDGRLKPDVVAKGVDVFTTEDSGAYSSFNGTSFAAPAVAGSAHLVSFRHEDLWGNMEPMRSSTLRGLISHTADDVVVSDPDPALVISVGPDYKTGWGTMDTAEAVNVVNANFAATYNGSRMRPYIKEVFLPDGAEIDFTVRATGGVPVKVSAAWTDPAGDAQATNQLDPIGSRLINDLDLTVTRTLSGGGTQTFKPWRLTPTSPATPASRTYADNNMNSLDNIEIVETMTNGSALQQHRIRIKQKPGTGIRQVDPVTGNLMTGGQWVSIALTGVNVTNINFAIIGQSFAFSGGNVQATLTWNAVVGQIYKIQRSTDLVTWTYNSGDIVPLKETVTVTSESAPASPSGFYRVVTVSPNPFSL